MRKHFRVKPLEKNEERKIGWGSGSRAHEWTFIENDYVETFRDIKKRSTFNIDENNKVIFVVELSDEDALYYVEDIIKFFKGELISYLSNHQFLIKCDESSIDKLEQKSATKVPKKYKNTISRIYIMDAEEKLSDNLKSMMNRPSELSQKIKVMGLLMPRFNNYEYKYLLQNLKNEFPEENIKGYEFIEENLLPFTAQISSSRIKEIASKGFVFRVSEEPEIVRRSIPSKKRIKITINKANEGLPALCVIDSGFNQEVLGDSLIDYKKDLDSDSWNDEEDHGTKVASVAICGDIETEENSIEPSCRIYGYKCSDTEPLFLSVLRAINLFKDKTKIFNLSTNYITYNKTIADITNSIDRFIQKNNIILVNSCSNIPYDLIRNKYSTYPDYLKTFPCQDPANGKNIFSVGAFAINDSPDSICKQGEIVPYCPIGNRKDVEDRRIKPDILGKGGNIEANRGNLRFNPDLGMLVIDNEGNLTRDLGTSFSAPHISNMLATLAHLYQEINNVETLKAILLSNCSIQRFNGSFIFKLDADKKEICYSDKDMIIFAEGVLNPRSYNDVIKKHVENTHRIRFYVPPQTSTIKIFLVHSDNYGYSTPWLLDSSINIEIRKGGRQLPLKDSDFTNYFLAERSPIHFAEYACTKIYNSFWDIKLKSESGKKKQFDIRYGIAIKLELNGSESSTEASYAQVKEELEPYM